jgi:hypothetical protein
MIDFYFTTFLKESMASGRIQIRIRNKLVSRIRILILNLSCENFCYLVVKKQWKSLSWHAFDFVCLFQLHKIAGSIPGIAASSGLEPLENLEGVSPPRQQEKDYVEK